MQDFGQNGLYFYIFTQHEHIINMIAATESVQFQISRPKCNFSRPNSQNSRTFKTMIKFQTFSRLFPFSLLRANPDCRTVASTKDLYFGSGKIVNRWLPKNRDVL